MKLISLYIENFGRFSNFSYDFNDNLNVFYQENGWGKTTLSAFIKAMLYGLNKTSTKSLDTNDRKKYLPWNNMSCGGTLTIQVKENLYKIERTFGKTAKDDTCIIYDLNTNKKTDIYNENIGEQILKINVSSFERSVYIPQKEIDFGFDSDISAKLSSLIGGVDDTNKYDQAIKKIDDEIKELKKSGNKGLIAEQSELISNLESQIEVCKQKILTVPSLKEKITSLNEKIDELTNQKQDIKKSISSYQEIIVKNERRKTVEKINEYINASNNKINQYKQVINDDFDINSLKQVKESIKEKDSIDVLLNSNTITIDSKYDCFVENGEITNQKLNDIESKIKQKDKNALHYIRYLFAPIILVALMATCIILMLASKAFASSNAGLIIIPVLAIALICLVRKPNKQEDNKEVIEFLSKYNSDISSFENLKNLNSSYILLKETIESEKENKKTLLEKRESLSNSIDNFFAGFKSITGSNEEKLQTIESTYLLLNNELENLSNLEKNKNEYESQYDLDDKIVEVDKDIIKQLTNKLDEVDNLLNELEKQKLTISNQKDSLLKENEVLDELEKQHIEANVEKDRLSYRYKVLTNTKELLTKSSELLQAKYVKPMKDAISKYFSLTLKDKSSDFSVNTDFEINFVENGKNKEIYYYSKGYQQLVSLCMRLALIDCLYEDEKPFIVLDDPFINLDDERIKECFALIEKVSKEMQVIYFTCHSSRKI